MMSPRRARHSRNSLTLGLLVAAVCAASFGALEAAAQAPPRYTVTDLGPFTPRGVNEMGQAVGYAIIDGRQYAVLYDGTFKTINPPGSYAADAWSVNNRGQV